MAMRLALAVGRIDVDSMLDEIEPSQFDEWVAFYHIEPFGDAWGHTAQLSYLMWSAWSDGKSKLDQSDFRPKFGEQQAKEPDIEQQKAVLAAIYGNHRNTRR